MIHRKFTDGSLYSHENVQGVEEPTLLKNYMRAAMSKARYEILQDDGTYYAEIPGFDGVYANADTLEACRDELEEVLEGWVLLRVSLHYPLPSC